MRTVRELEKVLAEPSDSLMRDMAALDGDILILGVGGKMGPESCTVGAKRHSAG